MRILAISTAFINSDVAIKYDDITDYQAFSSNAKHSENVLVCIDNLLKSNNIKIQDIEAISVVIGPGSFTGIRIGVGIVKGIYLAKNSLKLIPICSLDLMAYTFIKENNVESDFYCALDALSGHIFVCKYNKNGERLSEPTMINDIEFSKQDILVGLKHESLDFCNNYVEFSPKHLLDYSILLYNQNKFVEENNLLPLYLRKSQAEMELKDDN